jgi:hypothetical protein
MFDWSGYQKTIELCKKKLRRTFFVEDKETLLHNWPKYLDFKSLTSILKFSYVICCFKQMIINTKVNFRGKIFDVLLRTFLLEIRRIFLHKNLVICWYILVLILRTLNFSDINLCFKQMVNNKRANFGAKKFDILLRTFLLRIFLNNH